VFQRVDDAFYALDEDWQFTYVNDTAENFLGRRAENLYGQTIWEAFPEAVGTELEAQFREAMETQQSVSFERLSEPLDIVTEVRAYPSETGLSVYFRDVTER
jgi:PAS domain S-box-containing protein